MYNRFWWCVNSPKGIKWRSWGRLSCNKKIGGLGFRNLYEFNITMLGKQIWKIVDQPNLLVARLLKAKYFVNGDVWSARVSPGSSFIWKSLCASRSMVKAGLRWKVGDGRSISVVEDAWLSNETNPYITTDKPDILGELKVCDLFVRGTREWNRPLIDSTFEARNQWKILELKIGLQERKDSVMWAFDKRGLYTVKFAYNFQIMSNGNRSVLGEEIWKKFWQLKVPPKIKHFVWSAVNQCIPVLKQLHEKRIIVGLHHCLICKLDSESVIHALFDCSFAMSCWRQSNLQEVCLGDECIEPIRRLEFMLKNWDSARCGLAMGLMWSMWLNRNGLVWKDRLLSPNVVWSNAQRLIHGWVSYEFD